MSQNLELSPEEVRVLYELVMSEEEQAVNGKTRASRQRLALLFGLSAKLLELVKKL